MLWFRLALHLGATVAELQYRMSSEEFTYWKVFFSMEPFGYDIENFRMGQIASAIVNVAPRGRGAKPVSASQFYPETKRAPRLTQEQREFIRKKRARKE